VPISKGELTCKQFWWPQ